MNETSRSLPISDERLKEIEESLLIEDFYGVTLSAREMNQFILRLKVAEEAIKLPTIINLPEGILSEVKEKNIHNVFNCIMQSLSTLSDRTDKLTLERENLLQHIGNLHQRNVILQQRLDESIAREAKHAQTTLSA